MSQWCSCWHQQTNHWSLACWFFNNICCGFVVHKCNFKFVFLMHVYENVSMWHRIYFLWYNLKTVSLSLSLTAEVTHVLSPVLNTCIPVDRAECWCAFSMPVSTSSSCMTDNTTYCMTKCPMLVQSTQKCIQLHSHSLSAVLFKRGKNSTLVKFRVTWDAWCPVLYSASCHWLKPKKWQIRETKCLSSCHIGDTHVSPFNKD